MSNSETPRQLVVLLHGSGNGSWSWRKVQSALAPRGIPVLAPDMLGYGASPRPSERWSFAEETEHLRQIVEAKQAESVHLVAHSLGATFGLYLLRALGDRVGRITLVDPVVVSVLRETQEEAGFAEMEDQYQRFMALSDSSAAAHVFVEHWSGDGTWAHLGDKARLTITDSVPKLRLEMTASRSDTTTLAELLKTRPRATVLAGERTRVAPRAVARQMAHALGVVVTSVPGAAHMIPMTHPEAIVEALTDAST
ncbi:alpha/beta fold hydrolase [Corallococcus coralloides]|uniref:alpha/beta fold hydrolase n=1 Tax=Corallococcus coralloides TaxID=184914 RepID=UPI00384DDA10